MSPPSATTEPTLAGRDRLSVLFSEVSEGLRSNPRRIPEKLFYDERGSDLFEQLTRLEAYYPTRLEIEILGACLGEMRSLIGAGSRVVEFGSGDGRKTSQLLDALDRPSLCVPVDISERQLFEFADRLRDRYPDLEVVPLVADYTQSFALPDGSASEANGRLLFFFPGSTIGNFEPREAEAFLRRVGMIGGVGCFLLVGVDLVKERKTLERAYDDPEGVTAQFNRNALRHLNRLFDGNFDVASYEHRALWNVERSRIEMHLVSPHDQEVTLDPGLAYGEPLRIRIRGGEPLVTEHSYKYELDRFKSLCNRAGWRTLRTWTDDRAWFSVHLVQMDG